MNRTLVALFIFSSIACAYRYPSEPTTTYVPPPRVVISPPPVPVVGDLVVQIYITSGPQRGVPLQMSYFVTRQLNAPLVRSIDIAFGDGETLVLNPLIPSDSVEHVYTTEGSYVVLLTATDALERTVIAMAVVHVPKP